MMNFKQEETPKNWQQQQQQQQHNGQSADYCYSENTFRGEQNEELLPQKTLPFAAVAAAVRLWFGNTKRCGTLKNDDAQVLG